MARPGGKKAAPPPLGGANPGALGGAKPPLGALGGVKPTAVPLPKAAPGALGGAKPDALGGVNPPPGALGGANPPAACLGAGAKPEVVLPKGSVVALELLGGAKPPPLLGKAIPPPGATEGAAGEVGALGGAKGLGAGAAAPPKPIGALAGLVAKPLVVAPKPIVLEPNPGAGAEGEVGDAALLGSRLVTTSPVRTGSILR